MPLSSKGGFRVEISVQTPSWTVFFAFFSLFFWFGIYFPSTVRGLIELLATGNGGEWEGFSPVGLPPS